MNDIRREIYPPWTDSQVAALNAYQQSGIYQPFTCGSGRRTDHLDGEGVLLATSKGWVCPYCDYHQDWALEFMLQPLRGTDNVALQEDPC